MKANSKIIDFTAYREAVEGRRAGISIPLMLTGWSMSGAAVAFAAYVLYRGLQLGVFDGVVAAVLAMNLAVFIAGLALVRSSTAIRSWLQTRGRERSTANKQDIPVSSVVSPGSTVVSIEEARRVYAPLAGRDMTACDECGTVFGSAARACPHCGEARSVA